jgi:16S rRNA A1518/A1519 N6-dimethyltransferase RsmA/KsgA/DIM1 with predicted DNA glycosylase/AP lyase activity
VNSLKNEGYDSKHVEAALSALQLSPSLRAETLALEQFLELARCLENLS